MTRNALTLLQGTVDLLVLRALQVGPSHGYAVSRWVRERTDGVLTPEDKRQIISYLKKNEETPNYGGFTLGSLGPVSEGLMAWLVGLGTLVGAAIWIAANSTRSKKKAVKG